MSDADAEAVLEAAWSEGIRHFDTAPWYGNTQSEHRVGRFLRNKTRSDFKLTSKVGRLYSRVEDESRFHNSDYAKRWPGGLPFLPHFDFSADAIHRSYEDSLMRMGLSRIDGLAIHDLDIRHQKTEERIKQGFHQLEQGGGYRALQSLKDNGDIDAIGAGINLPGLIPRFLERFEIDYFILAMPYTLLDQRSLDYELPLTEEAGASVLIGAPFASGILATGAVAGAQYAYTDAPKEILNRVQRLEEAGAEYNVPLPAAALQLPLAHPAVASIIPGADRPQQVRENVTSFATPIPSAYWQALLDQRLIDPRTPVPVSKG